MNAELADDNVQAMRDQGIADACNKAPPLVVIEGRAMYCAAGSWVVPLDGQLVSVRHREAFAYARAYEANR